MDVAPFLAPRRTRRQATAPSGNTRANQGPSDPQRGDGPVDRAVRTRGGAGQDLRQAGPDRRGDPNPGERRRDQTQNPGQLPDRRVSPPGLVRVGVVARAHGIRGELKLSLDHTDSDLLRRVSELHLETPRGLVLYKVSRAQPTPPHWIVTLEGLSDRTTAEALQQARIFVPEAALPPPEPGEIYLYQLEGAAVQSTEGEPLGVVEGSFETGANIVLVVRGPRGEYLLPYIEDVIRSFDPAQKLLIVALLEGLEPS